MNILQTQYVPRKGHHEKNNPFHLWPTPGNDAAQNDAGSIIPNNIDGSAFAVPFLLAVPDYVQADWFVARPRFHPTDNMGKVKRGRQRIGGGLHWAIHQAVIVQKTSRVILADVVLAQVLWGGEKSHWPRNWRHRLVQRLKRAATGKTGLSKVIHREGDRGERECPAQCILHGTNIRHQHLEITISTRSENLVSLEGEDETEYVGSFLGALEVFGEYDCPDREYYWSPQEWSRPEEDEDA